MHLRRCGIPGRLVRYTNAPLRGEPYFERIVNAAGAKIPWPLVVYCYGPNGNGKTHMATWLASIWHARNMISYHQAREKGEAGIGSKLFMPRMLWTTERMLTESLKAYGQKDFDVRRVMLEYTTPDMLLIDDVFTEKTTETDLRNITDVLETRRDAERHTILTSNHGPLEISDEYSTRLAERLIDSALVVEFTGASHRMKQFFKEEHAS